MTSTRKKVVLITSGQPSINPRLVKEADALAENDIDVTVLYQYWNAWATTLDKDLLSRKKWQAVRVGGDPRHDRWNYQWTRLRQKASSFLYLRTGTIGCGVRAIARSSSDLIKAARNLKADLYIGHNLGALPAAVLAARYNKTRCGFDAEDFHRNEVTDEPSDPDVQLKKSIEDHYYPSLDYLTTASPLITAKYRELYPQLKVCTINNVFPIERSLPARQSGAPITLKLFWFSQTVGTNRGLEDIFKALGKCIDLPIELHILGHLNENARKDLEALRMAERIPPATISFHEPIDAESIAAFASGFDIGLATETGIPFNREICLTNKIFTYMQAGLSILASDTLAQRQLISEHPAIGNLYKRGNAQEIAFLLAETVKNPARLAEQQNASLLLAREKYNWGQESRSFIDLIKAQLQ